MGNNYPATRAPSRLAAERRARRVAAMDEGMRLAVEAAGGIPHLAAALGINRVGVWRWKKVPAERCAEIERLYGVPRAILRPDIFGEGG